MALRDASELLWPAVSETLATLDLQPEHAAAKKLAQRYAQIIDEAADQRWAARWLMPLLLDALDALGATPAAKARLRGGKTPMPPAKASSTGSAKTRTRQGA